MITVDVTNIRPTINNVNMITSQIENQVIDATQEVMDRIKEKANEYAYQGYHTWSHGDEQPSIRESWQKNMIDSTPGYHEAELRNKSKHACVVGSHNCVSLNDKESTDICHIEKGDSVLSKDGKKHKILATKSDMRVNKKPNLVIFNTEKSYKKNGTILTNDHMVLAWDNDKDYAYWKEIGNMKVGDYILKKIKQPWNKGTRMIKICENCGEAFKADKKERLYCSQECYHDNIEHDYAKGKHWTLSKETREKMSGENNHAYIDGRSKEPYGSNWTKVLKNKIKERDGYKCQNCRTMDDLVVHHIDNDKHNNDIDNLVTLCRSCHTLRHWRERDCELVDVDLSKFKPVKITKLEHVMAKEIFPKRNAKLYDLNVEKENSFVVNGILVHNSAVEFGVHHPITPNKSEAMHLGDGVYRKQVAGQQGKHFLTKAINQDAEYYRVWIRYIRQVV